MTTYNVSELYTEVLDAWTILYDRDPAQSERQWINIGLWDTPGIDYETACDHLAGRLYELGRFHGGDTILDVGCGTGTSCRLFSDLTFASEHSRPQIIGINITPKHIDIASRLTDPAVYGDSIQYIQGDATRLNMFDTDRFTKVSALECAFHFNTREAFLNEAFRLLRPGGTLVMADILIKPITPTFDKWRKVFPEKLIRPIFEKPSEYMAMPIENQITATQLQRSLENIGFERISIETINAQTKPFQRHYKKKMKTYLRGQRPEWMPPYDKKHISAFKRKMDFTAITLNLADYVLVKAVK
ncbi:MAG: class I SAM-dependent methyltransferase [Deltaproteobacteria bacterium]|nr:class I SAM-dependent methyltransferase [Deltaproteobacteria bacterium]MBN2670050.1 class I SAM-dependent methyltransferase [Deltaproteobacteria bacterium]